MKLKLVEINHLWDIFVWQRIGRDRLSHRVRKMGEINSSSYGMICPFGLIVIGFHNERVEQFAC